jgi:hypothetical protein
MTNEVWARGSSESWRIGCAGGGCKRVIAQSDRPAAEFIAADGCLRDRRVVAPAYPREALGSRS